MQLIALILFAIFIVACVYLLPAILMLLVLITLCVIEALEWLWKIFTWPFRKLFK